MVFRDSRNNNGGLEKFAFFDDHTRIIVPIFGFKNNLDKYGLTKNDVDELLFCLYCPYDVYFTSSEKNIYGRFLKSPNRAYFYKHAEDDDKMIDVNSEILFEGKDYEILKEYLDYVYNCY